MIYRDLMHFAGDLEAGAGLRYSLMLSTISDLAAVGGARTWVQLALRNRECQGDPAGPFAIYQVSLLVPASPINADDSSNTFMQPRLLDGATKHGSPQGWNWFQNRTPSHAGFVLNIMNQPSGTQLSSGVIGCIHRPGDTTWYQTCRRGWVVFEFSTKGTWNVADIGWGTISIMQGAGTDVKCNFIGDASQSATSGNPGTVCVAT